MKKYDHISTSEIEQDLAYIEEAVKLIRGHINLMEVMKYPEAVMSKTAEICIRYENIGKKLKKIIKYRNKTT